MFLKENKYEVFGLGEFNKVKTVTNGNGSNKKSDSKEDLTSKIAEESAPLLNF
jgi:hypothetical protein